MSAPAPQPLTQDRAHGARAARRVIRLALFWLLAGVLGGGLALWLKSSFVYVAAGAAVLWVVFALFTRYFFRSPALRVASHRDAILAPAHGLVDCVEETTEPDFLGGPCRRVSIFLSVFDVHVQHAQVAGHIVFLRYQPGRFVSALKSESAQANENVLIGIESLDCPGERLAVRQIAGLIARRVVPWVNVGDSVARGQGLGLIQYGSRCDLYLPLAVRVQVKPGDKVFGAATVVATRGGGETSGG